MKEQKSASSSREFSRAPRAFSTEGDHRVALARGRSPLKSGHSDESLVVDDRCDLRPAQAVEGKLISLLQNDSLPVSHLRMRGLIRGRCEN